jgi:hypothetical protein
MLGRGETVTDVATCWQSIRRGWQPFQISVCRQLEFSSGEQWDRSLIVSAADSGRDSSMLQMQHENVQRDKWKDEEARADSRGGIG